MDKKLVLFLIVLPLFYIAKAQRFDGGLLAGFNGSQVTGVQYNGMFVKGYHKPGVIIGGYVETYVAKAVFAAMEIKYSQRGARNKVTEKNPEKYVMRLGYIDVPVYLGFHTNPKGAVVGGVSFGYLVSSNELDNYGQLPEGDLLPFNTIDIQPFVGFQFDFLDRVKTDLRFALSVLPIRELPGEGTNYYIYNNQFSKVISLAAYYQLGR
ncbi:MAG: hypothetical protein CSA36_03140 [Draconibacterium sp.]|nr:MAG: hypothetical protein CSA36_03140 [Draconibacterium sp.]